MAKPRLSTVLAKLTPPVVKPNTEGQSFRVGDDGLVFDPNSTSARIAERNAQNTIFIANVPPENLTKEVSPAGQNLTLRDMRRVVGQSGVTGQHTDGNNEARLIEDAIIFKEGKKR